MTADAPASPPRRYWPDALLAVAVGFLDVALFSNAGANLDGTDPHALPPALLLVCGLAGACPLVWRRQRPVAVFAVTGLIALASTALVAGYQPVIALLVALYTVGAHQPWRFAWVIAPALLPYAVIAVNEAWRAGADRFWPVLGALLTVYALFVAGVWAVGYWAGLNRRRVATAQRQRAEAAERAIDAERTRISGELHDIIAHAVTVMVLQASGARRVLHRDPDRAATALAEIEQQGQQAISELRRMLSLLRAGEPGSGPQPGLDDVPALLDQVRGTGLAISWEVSGNPQPVDPSVGLAAYRVIQEALTNSVRYATPAGAAAVRLEWRDELLVTVTDQGPGKQVAPAPVGTLSTGNGLVGLRERVQLVGGRFNAGIADPSGFEVTAHLPLVTSGGSSGRLP